MGYDEEEWRRAYDELLPFVRRQRRGRARDLSLGTTDLFHEVLHRCFTQPNGRVTIRQRGLVAHVFAQVVRDEVQKRRALKRGGDRMRITPSESLFVDGGAEESFDLERLAIALDALAQDRPEAHRVVVLRFFSDLDAAEAREHLGIETRDHDRLWRYARAFLKRRLAPEATA